MICYENLLNIPYTERIVIIGNFDGVHLGHQKLIQEGVSLKKKLKKPLAVLTFFPQWQSILKTDFKYLLNQSDKKNMLESLGVDELIIIPFNHVFSKIAPEDFVNDILIAQICAKHVFVGFNFSFGYKAAGTPDLLKELLEKQGATLHIEPAFKYQDNTISSSLIRRQLKDGNVSLVNKLLGYHYHICGEVVHGKKLGRTIGFPTANISFNPDILLPAPGVYAATAYLLEEPEKKYLGVLNIGTRPTVDNSDEVTIEIYLDNFNSEIYGKKLYIEVISLLRHISKFNNLNELKMAIGLDVENAKKIIKI